MSTQVNGIDVLIADDIKYYVEGSVIDYTNSLFGKGFTIHTGYSC